MSHGRSLLLSPEENEAPPGRYGCPMLVRAHYLRQPNNQPVMRCALGWAIHNEQEVARCMEVELSTDCWKMHPEQTPAVAIVASAHVTSPAADD